MTKTFVSRHADETFQFGQLLAPLLIPGDFIALCGNLGAGKTNLVQGICDGLGVDDYVNSPTFTLINVYEGRLPVYHFDLYRLADISELDELGYEEYFWGDGLTMVEWAEKGAEFYPDQRLEIDLTYLSAHERSISVKIHQPDDIQRFQPIAKYIELQNK